MHFNTFPPAPPQKTQPDQKIGKRPSHFSKEEIDMASLRHENMLNITNYQKNANQNYRGSRPYVSPNGHHQENLKTQSKNLNAGEAMERREPSCTISGNKTDRHKTVWLSWLRGVRGPEPHTARGREGATSWEGVQGVQIGHRPEAAWGNTGIA